MEAKKSIERFQEIVARKHGLGAKLVTGHKASYFNEATELYVAQWQQEQQQGKEYTEEDMNECWSQAIGNQWDGEHGYWNPDFKEWIDNYKQSKSNR